MRQIGVESRHSLWDALRQTSIGFSNILASKREGGSGMLGKMKQRASLRLIAAVGALLFCLLDSPFCGQLVAGTKAFFVVAPEKFHPALAEYIAFKRRFRPTRLVSLERVLESTDGVDDPERLKRFLYNAWRQQRLGYVLLVGDPDVMPVRYMVLDRLNEAAFDYAFYPSDLYYADLAKRDGSFENWNAANKGFHAGYFGEIHGEKNKKPPINYDRVDYLPEIAFGRWPVSTEKDVRVVAAKSIAFERSIREGTHAGLRRAAFFHVECEDNRKRMNGWVQLLPPGWRASRFFFTDANADYQTPAPDEAHAVAALNAGAVLAAHIGHGSEGGWFKSLTVRGIRRLNNADRLPVLISGGCNTADFAPLAPYASYVDVNGQDHPGTSKKERFQAPPPPPAPYQPAKYIPKSFGKQSLKCGLNGAVVYIGYNTGGQSASIPLMEGFVTALRHSKQPLVGDCWTRAIHYFYVKERLPQLVPDSGWYTPVVFMTGMKFMFYGDPTLPLAPSPAEEAEIAAGTPRNQTPSPLAATTGSPTSQEGR
jgi:Peptidase family C25